MRITLILFLSGIITGLNAQTKEPTNKHFWYTLETSSPPEDIRMEKMGYWIKGCYNK